MLAIIPGVALSELWQGLSYIEKTLRMISWMVVLVAMLAMMIALLTSLNERRREMAILRALGATPGKVLSLMLFESGILTLSGVIFGCAVQLLFFQVLSGWLETAFGLYLAGSIITGSEILYLICMLIAGLFVGLFPAMRAMNLALKDGLSVRT